MKLPSKKAAIFWPVGTGDSTTLVIVPEKLTMQIDIRHLEKAEDPDEPEWSIIDHLVKILPKKEGKPYLAAFALTHPDKDHIQGFKELLSKVHIGELWHTPKVFRDQANQDEMCDDAKSFRKEADRRRKAILADSKNNISGNRLRVIGYDVILNEEKYKSLPDDCKSRPGDLVSVVDGISTKEHFHAFIHAPFKDDQAKDKNNTSLSMNVSLLDGKTCGQFFFFGDREYETIKKIFEITEAGEKNTEFLYWDVMLCSHHCSKAVMYAKEEGDQESTFKKDIMDYFSKYSRDDKGYIISSSHSEFSDGKGDNPPHKKARIKYSGIVESGHFLCTHEHPSKNKPTPIVFTVESKGFNFSDKRTVAGAVVTGLGATVSEARGGSKPSTSQVGFGMES